MSYAVLCLKTVPWSATLVIVTLAQLTMIGIGPALGLPSLLVVTDVGFFTVPQLPAFFGFFFFKDTATTEIYTLSLHDALPILMVQLPVVPPASMLQLRPELLGRVSETV